MKKAGPPSSTPTLSASQLTSEQYTKLLALLAKEEFVVSSANLAGIALTCVSSGWIIDSGASSHICTSLSYFSFLFSCL